MKKYLIYLLTVITLAGSGYCDETEDPYTPPSSPTVEEVVEGSGSGEQILWWMIDEDATLNTGVSLQSYLNDRIDNSSNEEIYHFARVRAYNTICDESIFLNFIGEDEFGQREDWDGEWGIELWEDPGSGYWGSGLHGSYCGCGFGSSADDSD